MEDGAIARFWTRWAAITARLSAAREDVLLTEVDDLVRHVEDIHPKIQMLGKYKPDGRSWLCLSSRGNLEIRPIVEAWARGAPTDEAWRFLTARPASWPPKRVTPFPLPEIVARAEEDELCEVIHLVLHHPQMKSLESVHQDSLAFMALDHLLGEDAVERWIGNVEVSEEVLDEAKPIERLRPLVRSIAERATGERWQAIRAGAKKTPLLVSINRALKPIDRLELQTHVRIDLMLQSPNERGLAKSKEALELDELQDELARTLGTRAVAIARESHQGHRIIHLHSTDEAAQLINTWRQKYPQWGISVLTQPDPQWEILRRWGAPGAEIRQSAFPPSRRD